MTVDPDRFAAEWYAAWNEADLERVLEHYAEDVVFESPFVVTLSGDPDGRLRGREALREYFSRALDRFPDLRFRPIATMSGVRSVVLHYVSVEDRLSAEVMIFDDEGRVARVFAHYGEPGSGESATKPRRKT